jgi:hypothetical protein
MALSPVENSKKARMPEKRRTKQQNYRILILENALTPYVTTLVSTANLLGAKVK